MCTLFSQLFRVRVVLSRWTFHKKCFFRWGTKKMLYIQNWWTIPLKNQFGRAKQLLILIVLALKWHLKHQNMSRNNRDIFTFNKKFDVKNTFFSFKWNNITLFTDIYINIWSCKGIRKYLHVISFKMSPFLLNSVG